MSKDWRTGGFELAAPLEGAAWPKKEEEADEADGAAGKTEAGLTSRDALRPRPRLCVPATTRYTVPAALAAPSAACYNILHVMGDQQVLLFFFLLFLSSSSSSYTPYIVSYCTRGRIYLINVVSNYCATIFIESNGALRKIVAVIVARPVDILLSLEFLPFPIEMCKFTF